MDGTRASGGAESGAWVNGVVGGEEKRGQENRSQENSAVARARQLIDALISAGAKAFVYCPGSRSAPLAYAVADLCPHMLHVCLDERSAAFRALGMALETGGPAVVITTSGTAASNLHPALEEARAAGVALIALSADRPHEVRGTRASQTTTQSGLYGPTCLLEIEAPTGYRALRQAAARATAAATGALGGPAGPVHINVAYAEPLHPLPGDENTRGGDNRGACEAGAPALAAGARAPSPVAVGQRAVVVAGAGAGAGAARFAAAARLPLLAEPTSGVREAQGAIAAYHVLLGGPLRGEIRQVIQFGHPTLSREISGLLADPAVELTVVSEDPTWADPGGSAVRIISGPAVPQFPRDTPPDGRWLSRWQREGAVAYESLKPGWEARAALATAAASARAGHALVCGASLPIRHLDRHAPAGPRAGEGPEPKIFANRGLAGIDGTVSTAVGVALASSRPVTVLLGDLTFLHDVGALILGVHETQPDVHAVVLDNGGGKIFAGLEHGQEHLRGYHQRLFAAPQRQSIEAIARAMGADTALVSAPEELTARVQNPPRGFSVTVVQTNGS